MRPRTPVRRFSVTRRSRTALAALAVTTTVCLFVLSGCAGLPGFLNDDREELGSLYRSTMAKQVLNPAPADATRPVEGMSGVKAAAAMQKSEGLDKPEQAPPSLTFDFMPKKSK